MALLHRPSVQSVAVAGFGALMLAILLGVPPLPELAELIPVVKAGNHLRVVVILMLCLALLAGWGLDDLTRGRRLRRRGAVVAVALGLLALPVLVLAARGQLSAAQLGRALEIAWGFSWPPPPADADEATAIRMSSLIVWLTFMALAAALVAARLRRRLAATAVLVLAVGLVAADLFKAGMGATPAISTEQATQRATPAIDYLQSRRPNRFVGLDRAIGPSPLVPNLALRWSLYDARSYDLPVERRYDTLWRRAVLDDGDFPTTNARLTNRSLRAFSLMSVLDIAQDPDERPLDDPPLALAYDRSDLRVYANRAALPRAGVVDAQQVVPGEQAQLDAVLDPSFDGRRTVVTPVSLPGLRASPGRGRAGTARIVRNEPERVVVEASARRPGELVLTDLHYPGWKATLDGEDADLHRVDYLLRGTTLPPGEHRVEFRYEPASWRMGWIVSLVALAGLLAVIGVGLRTRGTRARSG